MNCSRCNTQNADEARFCKNCGAELTYYASKPVISNVGNKQTIIFLLIILAWEYFVSLMWLLIQKVIIPNYYHYDSSRSVYSFYRTVGWVFDILTLALLIVFSILVKSNLARIFLIIFAFIKIVLIIGFRVFDR